MRYITFNHIAKRCPNGKRFDEETQTCIPREEWEAKQHHREKKQEQEQEPKRTKTDDDRKKRETAEGLNELRSHYGIPEEARKELKRFYHTGIRRDPFKRTEDAIKYIDKAIEDESVNIDKILQIICDRQKLNEDSYSQLKDLKGEARKSFLMGLRDVLEVSMFASVSITQIELESLSSGVYGQKSSTGMISYSHTLFTDAEEFYRDMEDNIRDDLSMKEVINPSGEKDTIAWSFTPRDANSMSDEELYDFVRRSTVAHEIGHTCGDYLENITIGREQYRERFGDDEGKNIKEIFNANREYIIEDNTAEFKRTLIKLKREHPDLTTDEIKEYLNEYKEIIEEYTKFDIRRRKQWEGEKKYDTLERKISKRLNGAWVYLPRPRMYQFNLFDTSESELKYKSQQEVIEDCLSIYKELYGLDDETFNPFDVYSEYGYYGVPAKAKNDEPSPQDKDVLTPRKGTRYYERIAEAFADVSARGDDANTMSVLIVSAVNYNIYKNICGDKRTFKEYFFGDTMAEQRDEMKSNRMIKSDEIAKKQCPEGYHSHPNNTKCHPISLKHRPGSKAEQEHIQMGLPVDGSEPEEKKPEEKKPEEKKPRKKKEKVGEDIEPYESGLEKPESLKYVMGFTRKEIEKTEYYKKSKKVADNLSKTIEETDWEDTSTTNNEKVENILKSLVFEDGESPPKVTFDFNRYSPQIVKETMEVFAETIGEYSLGLYNLDGFSETGRGVESYSWLERTINFNHKYFKRGGSDFDSKPDGDEINPITGMPAEGWSFHFNGTTFSNSVAHEYGHAVDFMLRGMRLAVGEKPKTKSKGEMTYEFTEEQTKDVSETIKEHGLDLHFSRQSFNPRKRNFYVSGKEYYAMTWENRIKLVEDLKKVKGVTKVSVQYAYDSNGRDEIMFVVSVRGKRAKTEATEPVKGKKFEETGENIHSNRNDKVSRNKDADKFATDRIRECESVYKKLYGVSVIDPTDAYSGYGYYGRSGKMRSGDKAKVVELNSGERVAEAYNDVIVRKEKANSMSQLIVAHTEFEYYQLMTGDYDMTFEDFIFKKIGKDKFKDRIVKMMRYIPYASLTKSKCPAGYHKASDGQCHQLDARGNPTGPIYQRKIDPQKQQLHSEQNKRKDKKDRSKQKRSKDVASQSFIKVPSGSAEWKMMKKLKVGDSDEAKASRRAVIDYFNKHGYVPRIDIEPFEVNGVTFDGKTTSYTLFTDENGQYTEERQKLHRDIAKKLLSNLTKPDDRKPIVLFTGGGSASGKGSMDKTLAEKFGIDVRIPKRKEDESDEDYKRRVSKAYEKAVERYKIDPDAIMEMLPEYEEYVKHDMIGGASVFHKEASRIAKIVFDMATEGGYDIIYDGTFSNDKSLNMAKSVDRDKYDTHLVGKLTDVDICKKRSGERFVKGGKKGKFPRIVPTKILEDTNNGFRRIIKENDLDELFDSHTLIEDDENKKK